MWFEEKNKLVDSQNGFRKMRSCLDHLFVLTSAIENQLRCKKQLYACFVDARKAFDTVDRTLLWSQLIKCGIGGHMLRAVQSLYSGFECAVRVNNHLGSWFQAKSGVKQGCLLSPLLFDIYINSLGEAIEATLKGVKIGDQTIPILLYADDVVLLSDNAYDLQYMLDVLHDWCTKWRMTINADKTSVMIFQNNNSPLGNINFTFGNTQLEIVKSYKYLGLELNEHHNWNKTVEKLAQSAGRALGVVLAKSKAFGGFDYDTYKKVYDTTVRPILEYSSELWGHKEYSTINAVFYRACRAYLKVCKYAPNASVLGDIGWEPPSVRLGVNMSRYWSRLCHLDKNRLTSKVFFANLKLAQKRRLNWCKRTLMLFRKCNLPELENVEYIESITKRDITVLMRHKLWDLSKQKWRDTINDDRPRKGGGGNKLRLYRLFKNEIFTEHYNYKVLNRHHRRALAQFRSGTAPLTVEVMRYGQNKVSYEYRTCDCCNMNEVEDEVHSLICCPAHKVMRAELFQGAIAVNQNFNVLNDTEKFVFLM
jgi:hypothetical protein